MTGLSFLNTITEKIPSLATSFLNLIKLDFTSGKIINLLILLIIITIGIKVLKGVVKWAIIILSFILIIQIGMSFV